MAKIKRVSIYDMDGTIVCSLHRYRTIVDDSGERIDLDYWRQNEYRAMDDSLLPLAEQYRKDLKDENCFVVYWYCVFMCSIIHEKTPKNNTPTKNML